MISLQDETADRLHRVNVERAAQGRLEAAAHPALHGVTCKYRRGTMLLHGRVLRYYHKQLAQEALRDLPGVFEIINEIFVDGKSGAGWRRAHSSVCRNAEPQSIDG